MRGNMLIYGVVAIGAAGLIYAAAQTGPTAAPPPQGAAQGHEGHQHAQAPQDQQAGNQTMPGMAGHSMASKSEGMHAHGMHSMMGEMCMGPMGMQALERPLVRSLFGAFVIPEFQAELGLTADQSTQLKQLKTELLAKGNDFSLKTAEKEKELDALFTPDTSKGQQVKALLEQIAELRAQQHYAIYTTVRKMKGVLTADQRNRLEAMRPEELHHAAMAHLTMEDFARAMELLRFAV